MTQLIMTIMRPGAPAVTEPLAWDGDFNSIRGKIDELVEGRLERVTVLYEGRRADMFVEMDSALSFLPENEEATKIYHAASLSREPGADTSDWPKIYGPAILFDKIVWS